MPHPLSHLLDTLDGARLEQHIRELAAIGATAQGGVTRLAFTREDMTARARLREWMQEAGLAVTRDAVGNLIGTLPGQSRPSEILACGSHIDTVVNAGHYDGIVGMVAAVECARVLAQRGGLGATLRVINFVMEESSRFGAGYGFGSRVMAGAEITEKELSARDRSKTTLARAVEELRGWEIGSRIASERTALRAAQRNIEASRADWSNVRAFLELHIEQGPVLERAGKSLGVVTGVAAPTRLRLVLSGEQNHSGTTPMLLRRDALAAAAEITLALEELARGAAAQNVVGTIGVIQTEPNVINAIPGRVELRADIRSISASAKRETAAAFLEQARAIAERRGIALESETLTDESPITFPAHIVEAVTRACAAQGIDALPMPSGAGHDAAHIARVAPAGMLFVLSRAGISHDPREYSSPESITLGARALLGALLELDGAPSEPPHTQ